MGIGYANYDQLKGAAEIRNEQLQRGDVFLYCDDFVYTL